MAFLWQSPNSKYWQAGFYDKNGRRRNRSTRVLVKGHSPSGTRRNHTGAQKIADSYEEAGRIRRTVLQARRTIMDLTEEISGCTIAERSLRSFIDNWLECKAPTVGQSTMAFYRTAMKGFLSFMQKEGLADDDIMAVTRDHITRYRNELAKRVAPTTVNHHIKALRTLFKEAKRDALIADNPAEFVGPIRSRSEVIRRPFTIEELQALIRGADDEWRSMVFFGVYTGQRIGDLARLTWRNIDMEKGEIQLVTQKTDKRLAIPIADPLLEHILSLPTSDDPGQAIHPRAFATVTKRGRSNQLSNQFANLLYDVGLRSSKVSHQKADTNENSNETTIRARKTHPLSFHSLRYTAITLLHELGVPHAVVQQLIGHDSKSVHDGYIGIGREALVKAAKKFPSIR